MLRVQFATLLRERKRFSLVSRFTATYPPAGLCNVTGEKGASWKGSKATEQHKQLLKQNKADKGKKKEEVKNATRK